MDWKECGGEGLRGEVLVGGWEGTRNRVMAE